MKWFRLAADQGDAFAQFFLGLKYEFGQGVPQTYAEALKWFRLAAGQGNVGAQPSLGIMYENWAEGVPQNYAEAVEVVSPRRRSEQRQRAIQ